MKLFDSELKVMEVLWREGDTTAKHISDVLGEEAGWNINTTYTLIKRCMKKGAIERSEPHFMCHALIAKETVQEAETNELIDKIYDGSVDKLFAALLGRKKLSASQIETCRTTRAARRISPRRRAHAACLRQVAVPARGAWAAWSRRMARRSR